MLISKTPFRISFFGGGTDYPAWYTKEGGVVLSTTIDKYCYLNCRFLPPYFNIKHRIVWSHIETVMSIKEILHPAVREGLHFLGFDDSMGLEIHHQGDLPARAGMGSSSAFAVGLINALTNLKGTSIEKKSLALKAIELERDILKEHVGSQDQVAAAYGGLNLILFDRQGDFRVEPMALSTTRSSSLESHLMLFYTGMNRMASEVAQGVIENIPHKKQTFLKIRNLVDQASTLLKGSGDLDDFGRLLHEGWNLKCDLSAAVTNARIDDIYQRALKHGALGGKLLGAGGAGFMVFYVPLGKQEEVKQALKDHLYVSFKFENHGSVVTESKQVWKSNGN